MRNNRTKLAVYLILSCLLTVGNWSCMGDSPGTSNEAGDSTESGGGTEKITAEQFKKMTEGLARARKQEEELGRFINQVRALHEQVNGFPAAWKKAAGDFAELETRFVNYQEKGAFTKSEVTDLVNKLNHHLQPAQTEESARVTEASDQEMALGDNWEQRLKEFDVTISDYREKYRELEAAVVKLKQANGAPVTLFR